MKQRVPGAREEINPVGEKRGGRGKEKKTDERDP